MPAAQVPRDARRRALLVRAASLAPFAATAIAWWWFPRFGQAMTRGVELLLARDEAGLRQLGSELGGWAALYTSLWMVVQALAAPIPAVLVTATNSWLFGPLLGGCLSIVSGTLAALLCFVLARAWGEPVVARLVSPAKRERAEQFIERHGASAVIAARLLPFVPFDPISYAAGLTRMNAWTFTWATLVGQIPAGIAYSYLAQEVDRPARLALLVAATLLALSLVGWAFRRAVLARRAQREHEA